MYITATPTFNLGKNQIRNLYYISDILPKGLGARVGSIPQESAFKLRKFPRPIRIIIYDSDGNVVSDTTQNGDGADKMDTPLYNAKYYSHQPTSVDTITKYDEEFKEVTDSTIFVHIRKKPPIIQTIVLPPPPPPPAPIFTNSSVASLSQNGQGTYPTLNPPPSTPQAKEAQYVLIKMGVTSNRPIKVTKSEGTAFIQEVNSFGGGGNTNLNLYRVTDTGKLQRVPVDFKK